jgi:hypothetical protein
VIVFLPNGIIGSFLKKAKFDLFATFRGKK